MKPGRFELIQPETIEDAVSFKAAYDGEASVLAGGQSLVPMLNFRIARPQALIDLAGVSGLDGITVDDEFVRCGAMVRSAGLERHAGAQAANPLLRQALQHVAHPVIRNRGTVAGTLAHADSSAEMPTVLTTLGGEVDVQGPGGVRTILAEDLFVFHLTSSLEFDEIITEVRYPVLAPGAGSAFVEFARRHGDFAIAGAAAVVELDDDGNIASARLGYAGIAPTAVRAHDAENALRGQPAVAASFAEAGEAAQELVDSVDEEQASVAYRRSLVRSLTVQALEQATARADRSKGA